MACGCLHTAGARRFLVREHGVPQIFGHVLSLDLPHAHTLRKLVSGQCLLRLDRDLDQSAGLVAANRICFTLWFEPLLFEQLA